MMYAILLLIIFIVGLVVWEIYERAKYKNRVLNDENHKRYWNKTFKKWWER